MLEQKEFSISQYAKYYKKHKKRKQKNARGISPWWFLIGKINKRKEAKTEALPSFIDYPVNSKIYRIKAKKVGMELH